MPLSQTNTHRQRAKQKRAAIHMLALSGVIRPGHIEPRYTTPIWKVPTPRTSVSTDNTGRAQQSIPSAAISGLLSNKTHYLLNWLHQWLPFKKTSVAALSKKGFNPYLLASNPVKS
jgi:hypothetical protein